MKGIILICLINLLIKCFAFGQKLTFENIGIRSGLPASEVYNLHQDKKGYIWVFTEFGIVRYNGSSYVPVCKNLSIKQSAVYAITEDCFGTIYFVNSLGELYKTVNDRAVKIPGLKKISEKILKYGDTIYDLFFMSDGSLVITGMLNSYRLPPQKIGGKVMMRGKQMGCLSKQFHLRKHGFNLNERAFSLDLLSRYGVVTKNWSGTKYHHSRTFYLRENNHTYFSTRGDELVYSNTKGFKKKLKFKTVINQIRISRNGHVWVCLNGSGVMEFDKKMNFINQYLDQKITSDILFDNQNGIWVSTVGYGVYHNYNIDNETFNDVLDLKASISSIEIVNNQLFVGTSAGKLYVLNKGNFEKAQLPPYASSVNTIGRVGEKNYVGTKCGFFEIDRNLKATEILMPLSVFKNDKYYDYKKSHDIIYGFEGINRDEFLAINPSHLLKVNLVSNQILDLGYLGRTRKLTRRNKFEFLFDTPQGLKCYDGVKIFAPSFLRSLKKMQILKLKSDSSKNIWICTKGDGCYCLTPNNRLIPYQNLPSQVIYDIDFDGKLVFLSTNIGAYVNRRSELNSKKTWKLLAKQECLTTKVFESKIYLGTKNGLLVLNRNRVFKDNVYQFWLSDIKNKNGKNVLLHSRNLSYDQNNLFFSYDFLDFEPHELILEYKLSGPTEFEGTYDGNQIHLQNLKPGTYSLAVNPKLSIGDGQRLTQVTRFTIIPAVWQTATFQIIAILLFTGLIVLVFWLFARRRNKRVKARQDIEKLLAEYRLTALKSQINPHFMSNSLVAIQNLILQENTDGANLYLAKFSLLLRSLLDYSNKSYSVIRSEVNLLELYVELEQLRFSNKFSFELKVGENLDIDEVVIPTLITQPFVENAIWHGLLPLQDYSNAKLCVEFNWQNSDLQIVIDDNGVGRSFRKDPKKKHVSKGTELIVGRLETLNQLYQTKGARIAFVDKLSAEGKPEGTTVIITIPEEILNELYDS